MMRRANLVFRKIAAKMIFGAVWGHGRKRRRVAATWLSGRGIEIGALHYPLQVPDTVRVTYLDRMNNDSLLRQYPTLTENKMVTVDIVDDGETLSTIADASQDFVIANHFLEHCENPIGALQAWLRVLDTNGIVYAAVPDKRFIFDFRRETTDWAHVYRDYCKGSKYSRRTHYMDWVKNTMAVDDGRAEAECDRIEKMRYSIHFHTWTAKSLHDFFISCRKELAMPFSMCEFLRNGIEVIAVLKKTDGS